MFKPFTLNLEEALRYDQMIKFRNHTCRKKNLTIERSKLFSRRQLPHESLDQYLTELKYMSFNCDLQQLREDIVKDIFIIGLLPENSHIKEKLLKENQKPLSEILELAKKLQKSCLRSQRSCLSAPNENLVAKKLDDELLPSKYEEKKATVRQKENMLIPIRKSYSQSRHSANPAVLNKNKETHLCAQKSFVCLYTRSGRVRGQKYLNRKCKMCAKKHRFNKQLDFIKPVPRHSRGPGLVLAFGQGDVGQLGLGPDILEKNKPAVVPEVENVIDIYAGGMHTVCLTADGEVITWGCNDEGALGRETVEEGSEAEPGRVDLPEKAIVITAGDSHTAALLESGRVFAWGSFRDSHGTMGLTPNGIEKTPVELILPARVLKLASGADHLALLTVDGQIYTCGCGEQGQLGRLPERSAQRNNRMGIVQLLTPAIVNFHPRLKLEFDEIWTGAYFTFAREKKKGKIYAFGLNNYNQLGLKNTKNHFHPMVSESFSNKKWSQMSGGQHHTIALDSEGITYAIGRKEYGRLGLGDTDEDALVPTAIPTLKDKKIVNIASGSAVSFAVSEEGEVWGWGMGTNNQLGTGDDEDVYVPTKICGKQLETRSVVQVSAGGQHTVILAKDK